MSSTTPPEPERLSVAESRRIQREPGLAELNERLEGADAGEIVLLHQILGRLVDLGEGSGVQALATVVLGWPESETIQKPGRAWFLRVVYPGGELATIRVKELPRPLDETYVCRVDESGGVRDDEDLRKPMA